MLIQRSSPRPFMRQMKSPLLSDLTIRLASLSETPALDASVLIAHVISKPRTWVIAHPELILTAQQQQKIDDSLIRLEHGEPLPYVLGHWEFFGLDFDVTPDVLIPRPETELLVERAIAWLQEAPGRRTVADVGTGSGAIAVSIAVNGAATQTLATDISREALAVASGNARKLNVSDRVHFVQCDLLPHTLPLSRWQRSGEMRSLDLICANLPYIPTETLHSLPIFGREPTLALDGGPDGLDLIRRLLDAGPQWLAPGGVMLLELEVTRAAQARELARELFTSGTVHLHQDLAGHDRLLEIRP